MTTLLIILSAVIFIAGAYFMGNAVAETFGESLEERIVSAILPGVICWVMMLAVVSLCIIMVRGVLIILQLI